MRSGRRVKGDVVKPDALFRLIAKVGPAEVRRLIGVTETTLYRAKAQDEVSKVVEVAAAGELNRLKRIEEKDSTASKPVDRNDEEISMLILELPLKNESKVAAIAQKFGARVLT